MHFNIREMLTTKNIIVYKNIVTTIEWVKREVYELSGRRAKTNANKGKKSQKNIPGNVNSYTISFKKNALIAPQKNQCVIC